MSHLSDVVIPALDAGASGVLDHLNPKKSGRSYVVDCPSCGQKRSAFYTPGHERVVCNRRSQCGWSANLWAITKEAKPGLSEKEIYLFLCERANVAPEMNVRGSPSLQLIAAMRALFKEFLFSSPTALAYLTRERGFDEKHIEQLPIGYYPSRAQVAVGLRKRNVDLDLAVDWGVVPPKDKKWESPFAGRIVGYWGQPDGSVRLWGRATSASNAAKYHFSEGMLKTIPYLFRRPGDFPIVCIEGPFDALSLESIGVRACADGGAMMNRAQAKYLAANGVSSAIFLLDDDLAAENGSFKSIANCESYGITTYFAACPPGTDDVDELRKRGEVDTIRAMVDGALNGGAFLVKATIPKTGNTAASHKALNDAMRLRALLTPVSAYSFDLEMKAAGVTPVSPEVAALRLTSVLADSGVDLAEASRIAQARYGLSVNLSKPEPEEP